MTAASSHSYCKIRPVDTFFFVESRMIHFLHTLFFSERNSYFARIPWLRSGVRVAGGPTAKVGGASLTIHPRAQKTLTRRWTRPAPRGKGAHAGGGGDGRTPREQREGGEGEGEGGGGEGVDDDGADEARAEDGEGERLVGEEGDRLQHPGCGVPLPAAR